MTIEITKTPAADSRYVEEAPTIDDVWNASMEHRGHVIAVLRFLIEMLEKAGATHDTTKFTHIDEFYQDYMTVFENPEISFSDLHWSKDIHDKERHHFTPSLQDDVNLIDVLEHIADITVAAMSRAGKFDWDYETLPEGLLEKAYKNTIQMVLDDIEVVS